MSSLVLEILIQGKTAETHYCSCVYNMNIEGYYGSIC